MFQACKTALFNGASLTAINALLIAVEKLYGLRLYVQYVAGKISSRDVLLHNVYRKTG